jgi:ABC-2 type transport system ATP-binding protein
VALVGANGAGKSTLIKALLDLRAIDSGSISIEGRPHTDARARDRVAYLPERFQPAYYLRGRGFIEYMLALYGAAPAESEVARVCGQLGLGADALGRSVQTYSKGMSQMLGLAACLLSGRPILVLDEPMSGLDPTARVRLQKALRAHREAGGTILFTTHLMADAEALADRVAVLHDGRIVADAAPVKLMAQYGVADLESAFVECIGGVEAQAS